MGHFFLLQGVSVSNTKLWRARLFRIVNGPGHSLHQILGLMTLILCSLPALAENVPFVSHSIMTSGVRPGAVATGDLDLDGDQDIVYAGDSSVVWLENDGKPQPTLTEHVLFDKIQYPLSPCIVDLNGDQWPDIVTASNHDQKIYWFESNGQQPVSFSLHEFDSGLQGLRDLQAADLDGDGDQDLAVSSFSVMSPHIAWFENDGAATPGFTSHTLSSSIDYPGMLRVADLDGDHKLDILVSSGRTENIAWFKNNGAQPPQFTEQSIPTANGEATGLCAVDLDGDHDLDVLASMWFDGKVIWLENNGAQLPTFTPHVITQGVPVPGARPVDVADIDGDGDLDVLSAFADDSDQIAWDENVGGTPLSFQHHVLSTSFRYPWSVSSADLNGDGKVDILAGSNIEAKLTWFENRKGSLPTTPQTLHVPLDYASLQDAIVAAHDGDEIVAAPGTYAESIHFGGKSLVLRSEDPTSASIVQATIIMGDHQRSTVKFSGNEPSSCTLTGLTITGGGSNSTWGDQYGGGICGNGTHATITFNWIKDNHVSKGGGLYGCQGLIQHNIIENNSGNDGGGLLECHGLIDANVIDNNKATPGKGGALNQCNGTIQNNLIYNNMAGSYGGALNQCIGLIANNTIYGNTCRLNAGGLYGCSGTIVNCIVWGNTQFSGSQYEANANPAYCCIQGWTGGGVGMLTTDPQCLNASTGNFRLLATSPCIDGGKRVDATSRDFTDQLRGLVLSTEDRGDGSHYDIGAYEATADAPTQRPQVVHVPADQPAIQVAIDLVAEGGEVIVAPGRYGENLRFGGKNITLTSTDPSNASLVATTILDGQHKGSVVSFAGTETSSCTLTGFTITGGLAGRGGGIFGGVAYQDKCCATIANNVITSNSAIVTDSDSGMGGGIYGCGGLIRNNIFSNNQASQNGGGLALCGGTIKDNRVSGNHAGHEGGGIFRCDGLLQGNVVEENTAQYGGGIAECVGTLDQCTIRKNRTDAEGNGLSGGGGVYGGQATIQHCLIEGNSAHLGGGLGHINGILRDSTVTSNTAKIGGGGMDQFYGTIQNNRITFNKCEANGGGIYSSSAKIMGNLIWGNEAGSNGGGIYGAYGLVQNNTIVGNKALAGGGVDSSSALQNCIIWGNWADQGAQLNQASTPEYSCVQDWTGGGTGNFADAPHFAAAATGDFHLQSNSSCIDTGKMINEITTDMDGTARPVRGTLTLCGDGSGFDIGAFEYPVSAIPAPTGQHPTFDVPQVLCPNIHGASEVYASDLGAGGRPDIFLTSNRTSLDWLRPQDETGLAYQRRPLIINNTSINYHTFSSFAFADLNGDGRKDILSSVFDGQVSKIDWHENTSGTTLTLALHPVSSIAGDHSSNFHQQAIHAADMNGDGHLDLVTSSYWNGEVAWYESDGQSPLQLTCHPIETNLYGTTIFSVADLNDDGRPDLLAGSRVSKTFFWYENLGAPSYSFAKHDLMGNIHDPVQLKAVDIDRDGHLDLVGAAQSDHAIYWLKNDGANAPRFTPYLVTSHAQYVTNIFIADMDHDAQPDILASSYGDNTVRWFKNYGGVFDEHLISNAVPGAQTVCAADLDHDGNLDVLTIASKDGSSDLLLFRNLSPAVPPALPPVTIFTPSGGETFTGGQFVTIHWRTDLQTAGTAVKFELWNTKGWVADLGRGWSPDGEGTNTVLLPLLPASTDYRLRVRSSWDSRLFADCAQPFTITGSPLRVNHPNGGEVWRAGQKEWVWWQSNALFSGTAVRLELWRGGFKVHDLGLAWDPDGEGVREVVVPAVCPGVDYKVRISSSYNPTWIDESDGLLTIQNDAFRSAVSKQDWILYQ